MKCLDNYSAVECAVFVLLFVWGRPVFQISPRRQATGGLYGTLLVHAANVGVLAQTGCLPLPSLLSVIPCSFHPSFDFTSI